MNACELVEEFDVCYLLDICVYYLGIVSYNRAVIVVVSKMLVKVIRHAGIENIIYTVVKQSLHMTVH